MQKSRLGISVGLFSALIYFTAFFSGWTGLLLIAGYALLCEENKWIKKTAVRALVLLATFSVLPAVVGLVPDLIYFINDILNVFGGSFSVGVIDSIFIVLYSVLGLLEKVLFLLLGIKALSQKSFRVPVVDDISKKHFD